MARMLTMEIPWTHHADDDDVDCLVTVRVTKGVKGRTYGDPSQCFPPEPPEIEVLMVREDKYRGLVRNDLDVEAEKSEELFESVLEELANLERDYD